MPNEEQRKKLLNIWEQVEKNKEDILSFLYGNKTLAEFGIKVIGVLTSAEELPDADTYEGDFGDAFAVGEESPYDYYVFTREGADGVVGFWLNIGEFPKAGPQGEPGEQGEQGPQGERGPTGSTGPRGANGERGPQGEQGIQGPEGERGPQGEQGEPGSFFHIRGKVASADLLPAAADVDDQAAYLVGAEAPYDVYCIMDVSGTHYWVNLGPVAVQESDTKVGSLTFAASGTLSAEVLNAIVNTETADFLKIGDRYFVKQSTGHYYALKRDSGEMLVYACDIDLITGEWTITTETMVDLDTDQTGSGIKNFPNTFNVIDGNDMTDSNHFTNDQVSIITNGKITIFNNVSGGITGDFRNKVILFPPSQNSNLYEGLYYGCGTYGKRLGTYQINTTNNNAFSTRNGSFDLMSGYVRINEKQIPAYPTTNEFSQVLRVASYGGPLSWGSTPQFKHVVSLATTQRTITFNIVNSSPDEVILGDNFFALLSNHVGIDGSYDNPVLISGWSKTTIDDSPVYYIDGIEVSQSGNTKFTIEQVNSITDTVDAI